MEEKKTELSFQEKGDKVIFKKEFPNIEMNSRDVLIQIDAVRGGIEKSKLQVEKLKEQIENTKLTTEENEKNLKKIERFEDKMTKIQESKAKSIYEEIKEGCRNKVDIEYKHDEGLTPEHNKHQKYCLLQKSIATHKKAAEELAPKIITKLYFKDTIIENPFK